MRLTIILALPVHNFNVNCLSMCLSVDLSRPSLINGKDAKTGNLVNVDLAHKVPRLPIVWVSHNRYTF